MVLYDGASIREIEKNFRGAVDEYLEFCKAEGKSPDVPFKGNFNVRVPQDLHQRAALYAEEHEVKLNAVVQDALREYLTHAE
jgi:predicted HicB family RNase H-like nuclease